MWPFRRKKVKLEAQWSCPPCPQCKSTNTGVKTYEASGMSCYIKVWRGQRYITSRCLSCGRDFYAEEPPGGLPEDIVNLDAIDEEELQAAEEELKRQMAEERERKYR